MFVKFCELLLRLLILMNQCFQTIGKSVQDGLKEASSRILSTSGITRAAARSAGGDARKVVAVIGLTDLYESEGFDRTHMDLPAGHNELIEKLCEVNDNVVVVLQGGSPVAMPWKDKVAAILNVYLQGEAVGASTMDVLYGDVNPGGKLAETYPLSVEDVLAQKYFPMGPKTVEYRESVFVGYRYF